MTDPLILQTVRVWADTVSKGNAARCRQRRCRGLIWFAQTIVRGKMMPFSGPKTPVRTEVEEGTGRTIWHMDERQIHFVTCKGRKPNPPRTDRSPDWQERRDA